MAIRQWHDPGRMVYRRLTDGPDCHGTGGESSLRLRSVRPKTVQCTTPYVGRYDQPVKYALAALG